MTQSEPAGGIADVMAGMPEVWRRLLAAHQPDRLGRCASCRTSSCSLHQIASEAKRLHGLHLGQAVAGD